MSASTSQRRAKETEQLGIVAGEFTVLADCAGQIRFAAVVLMGVAGMPLR